MVYPRQRHDYQVEKARSGLHILAIGAERIQDRLVDAFVSEFILIRVADVPEPLRGVWARIYTPMVVEEATGGEGRFRAAAEKLSDEEAVTIARRLVDFVYRLENWVFDDGE